MLLQVCRIKVGNREWSMWHGYWRWERADLLEVGLHWSGGVERWLVKQTMYKLQPHEWMWLEKNIVVAEPA